MAISKNRISKLEDKLHTCKGFWFSPESTILRKLIKIKPGERIWVESESTEDELEILTQIKQKPQIW